MRNFNYRFVFLFIKIVVPIVFVIFFSSLYLIKEAESEKKKFMYEKVIVLSKMISSIAYFDNIYSHEIDFNMNPSQATISQIKDAFAKFDKDFNINFKYLMGTKIDNEIIHITQTNYKNIFNVMQHDNKIVCPLTKGLNGLSGVEVLNSVTGKKVFAAYTKIENTPWSLVVMQPYDEHIEPFKKIMLNMMLVLFTSLILLFFTLRYFEIKYISKIKESEDRFRQLLESTKDCVWEVDANGFYTYISDQVEKILGYSSKDIIGKSLFDLMEEADAKKIKNIFADIVEKGEDIVDLEKINIHKDGRKVILLTNATPFFSISGKFLGYRGTSKDISELKRKQAQIEKFAYFDLLTGLPNRRTIIMRIEEEISFSIRNDTTSALIFLDLDGFKSINDSLGHKYGDEALKTVASRLKESVRDFDVVSRIGGDEFILLMRGKEKGCEKCKAQLDLTIQRIISNINKEIVIEDEVCHLGASLGVVFISKDGTTSKELIEKADKAMYKAKELGKNQAVFYENM